MNNKHKSRIIGLMMLLVFSFILMAAPVLAEGTGDGSGGGKNIPLGLDSSSPADGARDVSLTGDIKLTFNKNVIYLPIREANKKCFSLTAADGSKVPIEVIMADDQTPEGFEKRRDISVHPLEKLQPGTAYTVKVTPELHAKNGTSLGHEVTVSFVTEGTAVKAEPAAPVSEPVNSEPAGNTPPPAEKSEVKNTALAPAASEKTSTVNEPKTAEVEKTQLGEDKSKQTLDKEVKPEKSPVKENPQAEPKSNRTYAIIAGLVLIAGAGYLQRRKRMHK